MKNILYILTIILLITWVIGIFGYHATGLIYVLLTGAIVGLLLQFILKKKI